MGFLFVFWHGFIWDVGWLLDYWMIFFIFFNLLHYRSVKRRPVLWFMKIETFLCAAWRLVSAGVHPTDLSLSSYRLTLRISQSGKRKILPTTKYFFTPASHPFFLFYFLYCFKDNLQPYPKRLRCTWGADLSFYWPLCIFTIC